MKRIALIAVLSMAAVSIAQADVNCEGNACSDFDITDVVYFPNGGVSIKSITVNNYGNSKMKYAVYWSAWGQCNVRNEGVLAAGGSKVVTNSVIGYVGWCKLTAAKV